MYSMKIVLIYWYCVIGPDPDNSTQDFGVAIQAVLEEPRPRRTPQQNPMSGPELASRMKIGTRVMRGIDWKWGDQVGYIHMSHDTCIHTHLP